jgi:hypothetical protein
MDIKGAEFPVFQSGRQCVLASRSILAISIYHSLENVEEIPFYLMGLMKDYVSLAPSFDYGGKDGSIWHSKRKGE